MAKYATVTASIANTISRQGSNPANPMGMDTAVVAATKATRWASPVQVLTAATAPGRSRHRDTAAEIAPTAPSPSFTAKTAASESSQFSPNEAEPTNAANGTNREKTTPGLGCVSEEANPARIEAPKKAIIVANARDTRRKLRRANVATISHEVSVSDLDSPLTATPMAAALTVSWSPTESRIARRVVALPREAAMIQRRANNNTATISDRTPRTRLPRR